jgi:phage tail sheath protein FI
LIDEGEIALIGLPDLHRDLAETEARGLLEDLVARVDPLHDRMLLIDAPLGSGGARLGSDAIVAWVDRLRREPALTEFRSAAIYHPWLEVPDPLGGVAHPLKAVPPCGHVAGVVSRLDRERGPHHTPANAPLLDAVDVAEGLEAEAQVGLNAASVNLLRCMPGRGLQVWGGSTLARVPAREASTTPYIADHFIAYRRLIHRLVRAIRRVAEPLVFDANGPGLWLSFVRVVSTVLLEAYRRGALKGDRPEEAFQVRCDEKTNPPDERELGRCVCEIAIAPAAPMEFIVLRVALGGEGTLEVFES